MAEIDDYKLRPLLLPEVIVEDAANVAAHPPKNAEDASRQAENLGHLEESIRMFTAQCVAMCQVGPRPILLRDYLSADLVSHIESGGDILAMYGVANALMNIRIRIADGLSRHGIDPIVQTGIITENDFSKISRSNLNPDRRWSRLRERDGSSQMSSKINHTSLRMTTGPRVEHPLLHPETVYELESPDSQLPRMHGMNSGGRDFYVTIAPDATNRRTSFEAMYNSLLIEPPIDPIQRLICDMINAMELTIFLHKKGIANRDIKHENVWEGGVSFDTLSLIKADQISPADLIYGTPGFKPTLYPVTWSKPNDHYFADIFGLAISIADAISYQHGDPANDRLFLFRESFRIKNNDKKITPKEFMEALKAQLFLGVSNEKLLKAIAVVEKMILGEGQYSLEEAQRELSAIFGTRVARSLL